MSTNPAETALASALEVEAFLRSCRLESATGVSWSKVPGSTKPPRHTIYHGTAGVALFYLELHRATGDASFLDEAVAAGASILDYLATDDVGSIGFYSGWPGYIFILNELAKSTGDARFRTAASNSLDRMVAASSELGAGIGWIEPMPFSDITGLTGDREVLDLSIGSAGAGLGLLYAHRNALSPSALSLAEQTADRLLEMSIETDHGPNWLMMADMPFPFTAPNFAHGAAGVGYFLADLHRATDEPRYLEAAIAAAGYVRAKSTPSGDGHLVCHTDENPGLYYLGVCHGPPGTGRLQVLLDEITGDDTWLEEAHANMRGLEATGAPERRSDGLWQNHGQCCGDAGIGDYALSMYRATNRPEYLALADRVMTTVLDASTLDPSTGGRSWEQAEHRNRPDFLQVQTGYMQGASGIGSFLLHRATIDEPDVAKIAMPDSPFDS